MAKGKGEKSELVVARKTFKYTKGDDSELEAYAAARRHLRELHDAAVARVESKTRSDN
jgi:hypothetical protein